MVPSHWIIAWRAGAISGLKLLVLVALIGATTLPAAARAGGGWGAGDGACCGASGADTSKLPRHRIFDVYQPPRLEPVDPRATIVSFHPGILRTIAGAGERGQAAAPPTAHLNQPPLHPGQAPAPGRFLIESFPLAPGRMVTLDVQRFSITTPDARIVLGQPGGRPDGSDDVELPFDPESLVLLRGRVLEHPHSRLFIGYAEALGIMGWIELGPGEGRYLISSEALQDLGMTQTEGPEIQAAVFLARGGDHPAGQIPLCGTECHGPADPPDPSPHDSFIRRGLKTIELAVETDVDYYRLFDDLDRAGQYILVMYAACSDIFIDQINCKLAVSYVRLWDQPSGLNYHTHVDPLPRFRSNWNNNMGNIQRATAQYFSGRRDLPWGGIAYLNGLCNSSGYSVVAYAQGSFAGIETPNVFSFDVQVAAHELGHNFASQHTHDYGLDICDQSTTPARRGTIMSYCSQTVSGGKAVQDFRFETSIQAIMRTYIVGRSCIYFDCNNNGIPDSLDIQSGFSQDLNGNGIPDECEDCNNNGVLDSIDITTGFSQDLNGNGIPDECEPDCNGNNVPDDLDILLGTSIDTWLNGIPDECEADCNNNLISDYHEIMLDMTLDIDRDAILDSCQRCDGITPDLVALDGAHNVWIASTSTGGPVREVHARSGVVYRQAPLNQVALGQDLIVSPRRTVLVTSAGTNAVVEFDRAGAPMGNLVAPGAGGLSYPTGLVYGPNGNLFVASRDSHSVLEFDGLTGAFVRTFVAPASGGLSLPFSLLFTPQGALLVAGADDRVREYDGQSGAFMRVLVSQGSGGLSSPRGMAMTSYGTLLVASFDTNALLEYNLDTGAFIRQFNDGGTATILSLDGPWGVRLGPDGYIYASRHDINRSHVTTTRIFKFHGTRGILMGAYVLGHDTGIFAPTGFDWMPGDDIDCNRNLIPDHCDIASGFSQDRNNNGIPDECEGCYANCDGSAVEPLLNVDDFTCFINAYADAQSLPLALQISHYANCDGSMTPPVLNVDDFTCFINAFAAGCP